MTVSSLKTVQALVDADLLAAEKASAIDAVAERYAIAVTPAIANLIDPADPQDPLSLQFVPSAEELVTTPEERNDPIGDAAHSPVKGIVHRYPDRVLLKAVHVCPVYCRFCFRREMVGPAGDGTLSGPDLQAALAYIQSRPEIWEVILTGGDPLILSPRRLEHILNGLREISHVKIIRFHTRVPVVDPALINDALITALKNSGKTVYVAVHANHPREMTADAREACARLADAGIALVSQTVLLKGVNDDPGVLAALMRAFVECRVKPYYLHHPDLAPGTSHFRLDIAEGQKIVAALRGQLSGLCQPTYVLDIPGGHGKAPIGTNAIQRNEDGSYSVSDYRGQNHLYPPASTTF
ncbi:lysine-2,3-aminomutase-like protein [Rhizobium helianthi]|uniref:Lysine-2,3-aminomutase-like protein n=1 Tax=Rhizobium helianthi TaxID=1132695 RepID=A0ABW4M6R8_9HYPH